jgi:hypothetical protein
MPFGAEPLIVTEEERGELKQMTQSRTLPAGDVMRTRMILLLADGAPYQKIQDSLGTTDSLWRVGKNASCTIASPD